MPYIEAKMSIKLDASQKDDLQKKLTGAISAAFGKPKAYIMANIEDDNPCIWRNGSSKKVLISPSDCWVRHLNRRVRA